MDHASAFFTGTPGSVTRLQENLLFYGVTFLYAPTPQTKGKIVRVHHEAHREIGSTPAEAWRLAERENRVCLRPVPACPWWNFVWSERSGIRIGSDRKVLIGHLKVRVDAKPGSWIVKCDHTDGRLSIIARPPEKDALPRILFTNRPK